MPEVLEAAKKSPFFGELQFETALNQGRLVSFTECIFARTHACYRISPDNGNQDGGKLMSTEHSNHPSIEENEYHDTASIIAEVD